MTTSIGQDTPVFLSGEPPSLTEKPGRPQSTGSQRVRHYRSDPAYVNARHFLACGSSASLRVEHVGGTAAWLAGTLVAPSVQGHGLPPPQELWPYHSFFQASCSWQSEGLFDQSFSVASPIQALRGLSCLGSFSLDQHIRHLQGHPRWDPLVAQCVRGLMGQPLYCSAVDAGVCRERGYGDGSTHYV